MIRSLRPSLTREQAIARFRGPAGVVLRLLGMGRLRSVADAYVPFRLYEVAIELRQRRRTAVYALDAVDGSLDPFEFASVPGAELLEVETRNRPQAALGAEAGARLLEDKLRRLVFQTGFFRSAGLRFQSRPLSVDLHVPYWIGFYGGREVRRLRVIDAVRGRFEGARARALFEAWLAA